LLYPGARVFVCIPKTGYVGIGIVKEEAVSVNDFCVEVAGKPTPILTLPLKSAEIGKYAEDPDRSEYLVRIEWLRTKPVEEAIWEKGMFANQNSACKLRNRFTVERLTELFKLEADTSNRQQNIEFPVTVRAQHKGETFYGELLGLEGAVRFGDREYPTPTTAAKVVVTDWKEVNGWDFWRYLNRSNGKWERIGLLRK